MPAAAPAVFMPFSSPSITVGYIYFVRLFFTSDGPQGSKNKAISPTHITKEKGSVCLLAMMANHVPQLLYDNTM